MLKKSHSTADLFKSKEFFTTEQVHLKRLMVFSFLYPNPWAERSKSVSLENIILTALNPSTDIIIDSLKWNSNHNISPQAPRFRICKLFINVFGNKTEQTIAQFILVAQREYLNRANRNNKNKWTVSYLPFYEYYITHNF